MTTVYWVPFLGHKTSTAMSANILFMEPVPVFSLISNNRDKSSYLKCYAFMDYCRNTYAVLAPFDMRIRIDKDAHFVDTSMPQYVYDEYVTNRGEERSESDPYMLTLPPAYIFRAEESVLMEAMPAFLCPNKSNENTNLIPGRFDIGKWVRSVDFTFEVLDADKEIVITRGEPLFFLRFTPKDGGKVVLKREAVAQAHDTAMWACVKVKDFYPNTPLKILYEMAEPFIKLLDFTKNKK